LKLGEYYTRCLYVATAKPTSERQYKRKIKQWKLEKHAKAAEKGRALVSLECQDMDLEMDCVYKLNGKDIAAHKIRRYAKANGVQAPSK
jgi:hypothetical protein